MQKPKIRYIRFGKKDLAMLLFILLTVSCAIISVVMLQDSYDSDILNATTDLSSLSDSSMSSTKTTTTKKLTSKISKKTTMMTSTTKKHQERLERQRRLSLKLCVRLISILQRLRRSQIV